MVWTRRGGVVVALVLTPFAGAALAESPRTLVMPTLFTPDPCLAQAFPDVQAGHPFCKWIRQLALDEIATTCDGTNFCPDAVVTRAQLAMYLERAIRGTTAWNVNSDLLDGLDSTAFLQLGGGAMTGAINMQNNAIENIGNAGTDFLAGGALTLAGALTSNASVTLGANNTNTLLVNATVQGATPLVFEGGAADANEATLAVAGLTADRTVTLPDATGEVSLLGQTIETAEITDGTIAFADLGANGCANGNVIQRSGSAWACGSAAAPVVFVHTVTGVNTVGAFTILDNATINNSNTVKLFVTIDKSGGVGVNAVVGVRRIDLGIPIGTRWVIEMMNGDTPPLGATFNVLVFP